MSRRFHFERLEDVSGVSGTSPKIASGILFENGVVAITWLTPLSSVTVYQSISVCESIHSHNGRTKIIFDDPDENILPEDVTPKTIPPKAIKKKK